MLQQTQNICTYSFVSIEGALGGWRAGSRLGQQPPLHQQIRRDMWRRKTPPVYPNALRGGTTARHKCSASARLQILYTSGADSIRWSSLSPARV